MTPRRRHHHRQPQRQQKTAPPPHPSKLIDEAPKFTIRMHKGNVDKEKDKGMGNVHMAREFARSITELIRQVCRQSARENGGAAKFVEKLSIGEDASGNEVFKYILILTPDEGLFKLILKSAEDWPESWEGVTFLFSIRYLYLCRFEHSNYKWHVFEDAIIPGVSNHRDYPEIFSILPFRGSYKGWSLGEIDVGLEPLNNTYEVMRNLDTRSQKEIQIVLLRMAISTSEPTWMATLMKVHKSGEPWTVDAGSVKFSDVFHQWSNRSKVIRKGEETFGDDASDSGSKCKDHVAPKITEFPHYELYLCNVGVVLSRPPV